jgi:hypothetical protein
MNVKILIAVAAAAALTIGPALIEGHYVSRWGTPPDLTGASDQVQSFPQEFGQWKFAEAGDELSEDVCHELGIAGYISRTYSNQKTRSHVRVLLMVGQSGPLLRHPPYICYASMANEQIGDMTKMQASTTSPAGEFNLLEYKPAHAVTNDRFLVAYGMATDAIWKVPALPRIEFGAAPMLYKVQLLTALDPSQSRETGAALLKEFADDFAAAFQKHLQTTAAKTGEKPAS